MSNRRELVVHRAEELLRPTTRRKFLGLIAAGGSVLLLPTLFAGCADTDAVTDPFVDPDRYRLDLSTDAGILNHAYIVAQLEAAFYTVAVGAPGYAALSAAEQEAIQDLRKHEIIHRELLKRLLGPAALPGLGFSAAGLSALAASRVILLQSAQDLEDDGVAAYCGAARYLTVPADLLLLAKIASVEARHSAAVRDMRDGSTGRLFAGDDVVDAQGLDASADPVTALEPLAASGTVVNTPPIVVAPPDQSRTGAASATLSAVVRGVLDFALALEIFERELYDAVLGSSASAAQNAAFLPVRTAAAAVPGLVSTLQQLRKHETQHVATLSTAGATNGLGLSAASFDFTGARGTGNGPFAKAMTDLPFLLQLIQALEDLGARAYRGQLAGLIGQPALVETAVRIHSVEARHAARIRRLRRAAAGAPDTVRYSGTVHGERAAAAGATDPGVAAVTDTFNAIYGAGATATTAPSEGNVVHAGLNAATLASALLGATAAQDAAQEAFDEPLDRVDVVAIVQPFFIPKLS